MITLGNLTKMLERVANKKRSIPYKLPVSGRSIERFKTKPGSISVNIDVAHL